MGSMGGEHGRIEASTVSLAHRIVVHPFCSSRRPTALCLPWDFSSLSINIPIISFHNSGSRWARTPLRVSVRIMQNRDEAKLNVPGKKVGEGQILLCLTPGCPRSASKILTEAIKLQPLMSLRLNITQTVCAVTLGTLLSLIYTC